MFKIKISQHALNFSFTILLIVSAFLFSNTAQAAVNITKTPIINNYINIPAHPNNDEMLICIAYSVGGTYDLTIDGNLFTLMNSVHIQDDGWGRSMNGNIYYVSNSLAGQRLLNFTNTDATCVIITGIDTANPFVNDTSINTVYSAYANGINGNFLLNIIWKGSFSYGGPIYDLADNSSTNYNTISGFISPESYRGRYVSGAFAYKTITSNLEYTNYTMAIEKGTFIEINAYTPPPFATAYWAGVGSQYLKKNKENSVPIYYNFCNKYDDIKKLTFSFQPIRFGINKYTDIVIKDKSDFIGPQKCSGIYYAKITPTNEFTPSTGTLDAGISFVAELYDGTFKSTNVSIPYTTEGSTENYLENAIVEPLIVDMDTSTQTDLYFNYNFTGLTTSTTTVCAFYTNVGDSTDCTEIPADQPQGYGVIKINNPQVIDTVHVGFHAVELDMFSEVKSIIFFSKTSTIIGQYRASSSLGMIFGNKTAHDLACSPADWSEADSTNWFNMIRLKCVTFESTIDLFMTTTQGLSNLVENSVNGFGAVLGNLFPFNIPYNIVKSFQDSKAELPLPLTYFDQFDSNNAISIKIPKEWAGGETDLIVPVFGKTVIAPENTPAGNFFDGIRAFSVYSIWFLYIRYMWEFAKKVKDEVYPEGSTDHFYFKKEVND